MLLSKFTVHKYLKRKLSFVYNAPQFVNHVNPLKLHVKLRLMCKVLVLFSLVTIKTIKFGKILFYRTL